MVVLHRMYDLGLRMERRGGHLVRNHSNGTIECLIRNRSIPRRGPSHLAKSSISQTPPFSPHFPIPPHPPTSPTCPSPTFPRPSGLHHRYQLLHSSRHAEAHLTRLRDDAQARIHYLTTRNMAETSPSTIDNEEKESPTGREGPEEKQRREEIYRHVEGQLQDVAGLCEDSQGRVRALTGEVEWLMGRERMLSGCRADVEQMLSSEGK
ncbi:hypothetical protein E4U34_000584 [Claviceps purpurea]|nr:hypothetical protein E4U34_000584 [Claviceps purpurea]